MKTKVSSFGKSGVKSIKTASDSKSQSFSPLCTARPKICVFPQGSDGAESEEPFHLKKRTQGTQFFGDPGHSGLHLRKLPPSHRNPHLLDATTKTPPSAAG